MNHKLVAGAISLALILGAIVASPVAANSNCNPQRNGDNAYHFGTWLHENSTFTGVDGYVENQSPYVSVLGQSGTWLMLGQQTGNKYIQIGYVDAGGMLTTRVAFVQWDFGNGPQTNKYADDPVDTSRHLGITYASGNNRFDINRDGAFWFSVNNGFVPSMVQVGSETVSAADQFPGGYNDHVALSLLKFRVSGDTRWYTMRADNQNYPANVTQRAYNTNSWTLTTRQPGTFYTWDAVCP